MVRATVYTLDGLTVRMAPLHLALDTVQIIADRIEVEHGRSPCGVILIWTGTP